MTDTAFLAQICALPEDDGPRLVYADWLEEYGQCDRASFIRVQCELANRRACYHCCRVEDCCEVGDPRYGFHEENWCRKHVDLRRRERELSMRCAVWAGGVMKALGADRVRHHKLSTHFTDLKFLRGNQVPVLGNFRRGFVDRVELTTELFFGGPCGRCEGEGRLTTDTGGNVWHSVCPDCRDPETGESNGRVEGVAAALFAQAPVTKVQLSDKRPARCVIHPPWSGWLREAPEIDALCRLNPMEILPNEIWNLLDAIGPEVIRIDYKPLDAKYWKWFASEQDAITGLSTACVKYGRLKAKEVRDGRRKFSKGNT
jgi:uncharacterized protein (TIGR02996 family)